MTNSNQLSIKQDSERSMVVLRIQGEESNIIQKSRSTVLYNSCFVDNTSIYSKKNYLYVVVGFLLFVGARVPIFRAGGNNHFL